MPVDHKEDSLDKATFTMQYMTNPNRDACEGRFLSLAEQLHREGYERRHIAQAGLSAAIEQSLAQGSEHYGYFMRQLEDTAQRYFTRQARLVEEEAKAGPLTEN